MPEQMIRNLTPHTLIAHARGPIFARLWLDSAYPLAAGADRTSLPGLCTNGNSGIGARMNGGVTSSNNDGQSHEPGAGIC